MTAADIVRLVDEDWIDIAAIEDRWYEPDAEYFKVLTTEDKTYVLRYEQQRDEWTVASRDRRLIP